MTGGGNDPSASQLAQAPGKLYAAQAEQPGKLLRCGMTFEKTAVLTKAR